MDIDEAPDTAVRRSPPTMAALLDLYLKPADYFRRIDLSQGSAWLWAAWALGVANSIGRVDENLSRAAIGHPRRGWEAIAPTVAESWAGFWATALLGGALGAIVLWWVGGWWYRVRLGWAGATGVDRREARLVFVFSAVTAALPTVLYAVTASLVFPDYASAWAASDLWHVVLVFFQFWSIGVSYVAVCTRFPVNERGALLWFLVLPAVLYGAAFGLIMKSSEW